MRGVARCYLGVAGWKKTSARLSPGTCFRPDHASSEASLGPPRWVAGLGGIVAVGCWLRSGPSLPSDDRGAAVRLGAGQEPAWPAMLAVMAAVVTVNDVLDGHVDLDVECLDRIYLNGYVPNLQVAGQVVSFMTAHPVRPASDRRGGWPGWLGSLRLAAG